MILADKFTCDVPPAGTNFIECVVPGDGLLDWLTALGTIGAVVAAVVISVVGQGNRDRERWAIIADDYIDVLNQLVLEFPAVSTETESRFKSKAARLSAVSNRKAIGVNSDVLVKFETAVSQTFDGFNNTNTRLVESMMEDEFYSRRKEDVTRLLSNKVSEWIRHFSVVVYSKKGRKRSLNAMEGVTMDLEQELIEIRRRNDYAWGE